MLFLEIFFSLSWKLFLFVLLYDIYFQKPSPNPSEISKTLSGDIMKCSFEAHESKLSFFLFLLFFYFESPVIVLWRNGVVKNKECSSSCFSFSLLHFEEVIFVNCLKYLANRQNKPKLSSLLSAVLIFGYIWYNIVIMLELRILGWWKWQQSNWWINISLYLLSLPHSCFQVRCS